MADFRLTVDLDSQAVLQGFRGIETEARAAGERAGRGFQQALATQTRQSVTELTNQLARIQGQAIRINVDTGAFDRAGAQVEELQRLVRELQRQPINIPVDQSTQRGVQGVQRNISDLIAQLAQLQARQVRLSVNSAAYDRLGVRIQELQGEIQQLSRERLSVNADPRSLEVMRQRVADLTGALDRVAVGSPAFQALTRDVAAASAELQQAERSAGLAQRGFSGLLQTLAGLGVGAAVVGFFKGAITEASNLESVTRKLSNTLGPSGAAGALDFTRKLSSDLGLSFKTLSSGFASFTAAATAANVPIEQQKGLFAAVAKTGQNLGMSNDEISGSLLALQQIASKGRVSMEELGGQLGERMPIALAAAAKGLGVTTSELIKMVESGKLTASQFFPALTKGLNELTSGSGGARTAAQGFQDLQNAWDNLQTAFGQTVLPTVVGVVSNLAKALNGATSNLKALVQVGAGIATFAGAFWLITAAVNAYRKAQQLATAAAIFFQAVMNPGNILKIGASLFAAAGAVAFVGREMDKAAKEAAKNNAQLDQTKEKTNATNAEAKKTVDIYKQQTEEKSKELTVIGQILQANQGLAEAQARYQSQIAGLAITQREAFLSYANAAQAAEQSLFDIARSRNQFELNQLQERGASEAQLRNKRKEGEAIELAALQSRIAQQRELQRIELQVLGIKQQQAQLEARVAVEVAVTKAKQAQLSLDQAMLTTDRAKQQQAQLALQAANLDVQAAEAKRQALGQLQPLEAATVLATQQTARNQEAAKAAALGYTVAVDGTLQAVRGVNGQFEALTTITANTAEQQQRLLGLARATGLEARTTAQGSVQIGRALAGSQSGARTLAGSFSSVGQDTSIAATGAQALVASLSRGQIFISNMANTRIDTTIGNAARKSQELSTGMNNAANAANRFYNNLYAAAGLPAARWAGGPVAAGQTVRINDGPAGRSLGQESFLSSSGKLSLIHRPANSLWAAPSRGLVVPAAVTEQLKEAGAFGPRKALAAVAPRITGADPATAALAVEVSRLRAEVGELNRKRWDVRVNLRQDGSGLRMQRMLNGML